MASITEISPNERNYYYGPFEIIDPFTQEKKRVYAEDDRVDRVGKGKLVGMPVIFLENPKNGDLCRFVPCQRGDRFVLDDEGTLQEVDDTALLLFRRSEFNLNHTRRFVLGGKHNYVEKDHGTYFKIFTAPLSSLIISNPSIGPPTLDASRLEREHLKNRLKERKVTIVSQVVAKNDETLHEPKSREEQTTEKKLEIQGDSFIRPEDRKDIDDSVPYSGSEYSSSSRELSIPLKGTKQKTSKSCWAFLSCCFPTKNKDIYRK